MRKQLKTVDDLRRDYLEACHILALDGIPYTPAEYGYGVYCSYEVTSKELMKDFLEEFYEDQFEVEEAMEMIFFEEEGAKPLQVANNVTGEVLEVLSVDRNSLRLLKRKITESRKTDPENSYWYVTSSSRRVGTYFTEILKRVNNGCWLNLTLNDKYDHFNEFVEIHDIWKSAEPYYLVKRINTMKTFGEEIAKGFTKDKRGIVESYKYLKKEFDLSMADVNRLLWYYFEEEERNEG